MNRNPAGRSGPPRGRKLPHAVALAAALLLAPPAFSQNSGNPVKDLFGSIKDKITGQQPAVSDKLSEALRESVKKNPVPPDLTVLFLKGTVNGEELIGTLQALQRTMRERRAALAMATLVGAADSALNATFQGNFDVTTFFKDKAIDAAMVYAKQTTSNAAADALDKHMRMVLDDPAALRAETVKLPSIQGLTGTQARRIVTMAALVVGARVTGKMLDHAQKDLDSLRKDYSDLIEQREKTAKLFFTAIAQRSDASQADFGDALDADDQKFIDSDLAKMSIGDFAKDMAAQNLALRLLRKSQPEAFADYRTKTDDVVKRSKAYVQTMTGIAAFGAISANFILAIGEVAKDQDFNQFLKALPLTYDFVKAAAPTIELSVKSATTGVMLSKESFIFGAKNFVFVNGDKATEDRGAKEVFADLAKTEAADQFKGALFRSDAPGLLQRVGECDQAEAGRMLDATTTKDERQEFAGDYFEDEELSQNFSFYTALEAPGPSQRQQLLAGQLLASDYRERGTSDAKAISKIQLRVSEKYKDWNDPQLLRLIFANRETPARYATLYVGQAKIKPRANADSLFAYETLTNACKVLLMPKPVKATPKVAAESSANPPGAAASQGKGGKNDKSSKTGKSASSAATDKKDPHK